MDDAPLSLLTSNTKMYGASPTIWGWANLLDAGGSSNKRWPVYQFNAAGELRRAFVGGLLYKAEGGRLIELHRQRSPTEVSLVRRDLSEIEATDFLATWSARLTRLHQALAADAFQTTGQVPADCDVPSRVRDWLAQHASSLCIASRPHAQ